MNENILILQAIFDIAIVIYILMTRYFTNRERESILKLIESLRLLLDKQRELINTANNRIMEQQERINRLLEDVRRKNSLLTELLTTIKNKSYKPDIKNRIIEMRKSNMSLDEIAKNLNMSKGEIELIIKLYEEENR